MWALGLFFHLVKVLLRNEGGRKRDLESNFEEEGGE
jgi:hypothetical protein